jgi:hypothetical protein
MSRTTDTVEVEICDVCNRRVSNPSLMHKCVICEREYCTFCQGVGTNAFREDICKDCIKRKDVQSIFEQYLELRYRPAVRDQRMALKALPKITSKVTNDE